MAGVPKGLRARPSCAHSTLRAPLSTTAAPYRRRMRAAAPGMSARISAVDTPSSRAASPGWGVSTIAAPSASQAGRRASRLSASASSTQGSARPCRKRSRRSISAAAIGPRPSPQPAPSASARSSAAERDSQAASSSSAGSGAQVAQGQSVCTTSTTSSGRPPLPAPRPRAGPPSRRWPRPLPCPGSRPRAPRGQSCPCARFSRGAAETARPVPARACRPRRPAPRPPALRPMSATVISPAKSGPCPKYSPGLGRWKVTVSHARTAAPITCPVSPFSPEGDVHRHHGHARLRQRIERLAGPRGPRPPAGATAPCQRARPPRRRPPPAA